ISATGGTLSASFLAYDPSLGLGSSGAATSGGYVELTSGDEIAVWQGLFAEVTSPSGGTVSFTYAAASRNASGTPVFFGRADRPTTFALMLDGEVDINGTLYPVVDAVTKARFREGATNGFDRFDLSELAPPNGIQASLAFATERDGAPHRLGVHSMPETLKGSVTLPVEFASTAPGTFTISGELVSIPEGWMASLRDLVTGAIVDLTGDESHTFTTDTPTEWTPRFELVVSASSSVATQDEAQGFELSLVTPNPAVSSASLALRVDAPQFVTATVVDALGRVVQTPFADELAPSTDAQISVNTAVLAPGTYVVRVEGETFAQSRRLTVVR
ncbi:MAG: T9SS type A sorting domain-containing protein, partial [Bacteroidota bacterium]